MTRPLISLKVPATMANLGPGFDVMGMALTLYNVFDVEALLPEGEHVVHVTGEGAGELDDPERNLVIRSYLHACAAWGIPPRGFVLQSDDAIPLRRGLGSSSTAVVAGVVLAREISGSDIPLDEMLRVMTSIEGHPDNVVPCMLGGMVVSCWDGSRLSYVEMPPLPEDVLVIASVPDVQVSTADARKALPETIPFGDAVFNVGRASLLCAAWASGRWDLLFVAVEDRLHQPHRAKLFPGGEEMLRTIRARPDCLAVAISGSGPTVVALGRGPAEALATAMGDVFAAHGVSSRSFVLNGTDVGTTVERDVRRA